MGMFDSDETIRTKVNADMAYDRSKENSRDLRDLDTRLEKLEEYLGLEWSESNRKYYKEATGDGSDTGSRANAQVNPQASPSELQGLGEAKDHE